MSVVCEKVGKGWIIDHEEIIKNIYNHVLEQSSTDNSSYKSFSLNKDLFEIVTPFLNTLEAKNIYIINGKHKRKRKYTENPLPSQDSCEEVSIIKSALKELLRLQNEMNHFSSKPSSEDFQQNNEAARKTSNSYFNEICCNKFDECSGGNSSERPVLANIKNNRYLIPNNSKFLCTDVHRLLTSLPEDIKFDFILMDPPWWNKYIRRRKKNKESAGYKMMYNEDVCRLPVGRWLAPGALVAVWCTNCVRHIQDIVSQWFPSWGLHHVATWYWVKVTRSGDPVCQFSPPPGKQPYERILFGAVDDRTHPQPPNNQCIISVPSSIHSHKPPLIVDFTVDTGGS